MRMQTILLSPAIHFPPRNRNYQGAWRGDRRDQRTGGHAICRWMPAARIVGKSRSHVARTYARCSPEGRFQRGMRALLAVAEPDAIADRIVAEGMTVRDIERLG